MKSINKVEITKTIFNLAIDFGAMVIVNDAISAVSPVLRRSSVVRTICVGITGVVLADMMADRLAEYANNKIDEIVDSIKKGGESNV